MKRNYPHIFFESVKILLKGGKGLRSSGRGDRGEDRRAARVRRAPARAALGRRTAEDVRSPLEAKTV